MFFEYICKNYYVAQDLTDDRPIFVAQSVTQQKSSELMITAPDWLAYHLFAQTLALVPIYPMSI